MRPRGSWPIVRALCAACFALLLAGVSAEAQADSPDSPSIGVPIVTSSPTADTNTTPADGAEPDIAARGNITAPPPPTPAPALAPVPAPEPVPAPAPAPSSDDSLVPGDATAPDAASATADAEEPLMEEEEDEAEDVGDDEEPEDEDVVAAGDQADGGQRSEDLQEVDLRSPTLVDAFDLDGDLIAVKHLTRFEERLCSSGLICDSAFVSVMMLLVSACGAFIVTHVATFLPEKRAKPERVGMTAVETLDSTATATTAQSSLYRPPTGEQYRWPLFLSLYRDRSTPKHPLRIGHSAVLWLPAIAWAIVAFGTSFIVTPAEAEVRLDAPVSIVVTDAAQWGAVRFDGCNDVVWHVDDDVSPMSLRRTVRRCYDARRLAGTELAMDRLPPAGQFASLVITSDHVRVAVLYENGGASTISRVSARVVDLREQQPPPLQALRGGAGGGRTDAYGMFLTSRVRLEALVPYFETAMQQPRYRECSPPRFRFLDDDGSTFSGRWTFQCSPQRGAELGVDGLLLAVYMRHTEYRYDPRRSGETFEVFVPVVGEDDTQGEVIEVVGWPEGMLIGHVGTIWCNWLCSVVVAGIAIACAATVAALTAFLSKNLPSC